MPCHPVMIGGHPGFICTGRTPARPTSPPSQTRPIPLATARKWANAIAEQLAPLCHRLEIAGSIRRERPACNDIDLVCIPRIDEERDMLGAVLSSRNQVKEWATAYVAKHHAFVPGPAEHQPRIISSGEKSLIVQLRRIQLDIWFATEATFATRLVCRTGSKEHNIWLADRANDRGGHWNPYEGLRMAGKQIDAASESDLYRAFGLNYIDPRNRELPYLRKIDSGL